MFESAELGHKIKKSLYEQEVPTLREDLLNTQMELAKAARFPVIILIGGLDGAGTDHRPALCALCLRGQRRVRRSDPDGTDCGRLQMAQGA